MIPEETSGKTRQLRGGTERLKRKDAFFAEFSGSSLEKNPQIQKSQSSGLGYDHLDEAAQVTPTSSGLPGSGEDTMLTSGSQPYDPRTNYLSPRPQFLCYNPKRLREIYLRRETKLERAERDSGFDSGLLLELENPSSVGTLSASLPSPSPKQEDGLDLKPFQDKESYDSMDDQEDDTAEEERPSCCNLVWKILLLLGILFSITGYISSMYPFSALSSSKKFQNFEEHYLKIQDASQETAGNIGMNLEKYSGTYMNTGINDHFHELTTMDNGIGGINFDRLCKFGKIEGEKMQEEGKSMVKDGSDFLVDDVKSNANPFIVRGSEWPISSGEELQDETQMIMSEDSEFLASNKNQNDFLVMAEGEGDEYSMYAKETQHDNEMIVADDSYVVVDNENLTADMVVVDGENEVFISTDKVYDPEHENRYTGDTISEEHMEDVMMETEIGGTGDVTLKLNKPAEAPQRQTISGYEEKDSSFENGKDFSLFGMKVVITVLMILAFATTTIFSFRHLRKVQASVKDSSASFPSSGLASESGSELPNMEKLKKDLDNYPPAVELFKEKFVDSFISTNKSKKAYETHPPTVELLGEFSVAELGFPKTGDSSLGKKTVRANVHHSQSPEISMRNSLPSVDQSPSEFSTTESTPRRKSDQDKLGRKHSNQQRHGTVEAVSTPLRRSSRIRNRFTSP